MNISKPSKSVQFNATPALRLLERDQSCSLVPFMDSTFPFEIVWSCEAFKVTVGKKGPAVTLFSACNCWFLTICME